MKCRSTGERLKKTDSLNKDRSPEGEDEFLGIRSLSFDLYSVGMKGGRAGQRPPSINFQGGYISRSHCAEGGLEGRKSL